MNTYKYLTPVILNVALEATYMELGLSAQTFAIASVRAACKLQSVRPVDVGDEEMRYGVDAALAYLIKKGLPPCTKDKGEGVRPLSKMEIGRLARQCVAVLNGTKAKETAAARAKEKQGTGEISQAVPQDKAPAFDATALTLAQGSSAPRMRELAASLTTHKDVQVAELAKLVTDWLS